MSGRETVRVIGFDAAGDVLDIFEFDTGDKGQNLSVRRVKAWCRRAGGDRIARVVVERRPR